MFINPQFSGTGEGTFLARLRVPRRWSKQYLRTFLRQKAGISDHAELEFHEQFEELLGIASNPRRTNEAAVFVKRFAGYNLNSDGPMLTHRGQKLWLTGSRLAGEPAADSSSFQVKQIEAGLYPMLDQSGQCAQIMSEFLGQ